MFIVFNKEKIQTYLVSILTVAVLIGIANLEQLKIVETNATSRKIPIYNVQTDENKVALTMNCAWTADDIDKILEVLKNNNIHITFFIVGEWANKYPEAVKKIYESGHEIGTHSDTHPHVNKLSLEENTKEIQNGIKKIKEITGKDVNLYRTPYGEYNDVVISAAEKYKLNTIQWNIDTLDYEGLTGNEMWKKIEGKLQKGSIILSHNGTKYTAESLNMLIKNIQSKGFQIVKVSELIYKQDFIINSSGTQIKNNE